MARNYMRDIKRILEKQNLYSKTIRVHNKKLLKAELRDKNRQLVSFKYIKLMDVMTMEIGGDITKIHLTSVKDMERYIKSFFMNYKLSEDYIINDKLYFGGQSQLYHSDFNEDVLSVTSFTQKNQLLIHDTMKSILTLKA